MSKSKGLTINPMPDLKVFLVQSARELKAVLAELNLAPSDPESPKWSTTHGAYGITWSLFVDNLPVWIVGLTDTHETPLDVVSTLVHESVHVWQGYSAYLGEDKASDEFEAYSIQNITAALLAEYRTPRGRKPKV